MYKVQKPSNPEANSCLANQEITNILWIQWVYSNINKSPAIDGSYSELDEFSLHPPVQIPEDPLKTDNTCKVL
jgi:hypothetical protein